MKENNGDYRIIVISIETNNSVAISSRLALEGRSLKEAGVAFLSEVVDGSYPAFYTNTGKYFFLPKEALNRVYFNFELCEETSQGSKIY